MILYGASGHAKVIIDILNKSNNKIKKIVDDNISIGSISGIRVFSPEKIDDSEIIIAIGNNKTRKEISRKINSTFGKAIHPKSIIDPTVNINGGTVVMAGVIINSSTKIGKHCIINTSSSVDHDCTIEDFVHVSPNATLCGGIHVGEGTHIGAGATIIPGVKIGKWCVIGAGAVIIKNVPDGVTVVGNPGKIVK